MSTGWMPLNDPAAIDLVSALIGAGVGLAAGAIAAYRLHDKISQTVQATRGQAAHVRERVSMGVQQRYLEWVAARAAALHVLRDSVPLADLYVVPELTTPPPHPSGSEKSFEPPPTVPVAAAIKATNRLIIAGRSGSGRSALLAHIASVYAADRAQAVFGVQEQRLPIYLHLADLAFEPEQVAPESVDHLSGPAAEPKAKTPPDPAKPLVDAVAARLPLLVQAGGPGLLRERIKAGEALVLLDGLDEVDPDAKPRVMDWIKTFGEANPNVRMVVAAGPAGLGPLLQAGFAVIELAPWTPVQVARLAERWAKAVKGGAEDAERVAATLKPIPGTSPLPIDVTLSAFVWQKRGTVTANRAQAYGQSVDILLESVQATSPLSPTLARAAMGRLALTLFKENRLMADRAEIEKLALELLPPPETKKPAPASQPAEGQAPGEAPAEGGQQAAPPPKPKGLAESVETLAQRGLLVERGKDRFAFAHRRIQSYLAAWQITQSGEGAVLAQHLDDPVWEDVFEFCAGLVNIAPLVDTLLKRDDDMFRTRLWTVAGWLASAGSDVPWRGKVLAQVAAQFMQPGQLPPLRERAMLALLSTQDKGLGYLFKQALSSPDPLLRAEGIHGLGMLQRESDLIAFKSALQDPDQQVRETAVRAMGSVSGKASIEYLASVLLEADESLRRVAALRLAESGDEGRRILKEATQEEDMLVRRAATFGLAATGQDWARDLLSKLEREDPQWFVRSAATEALAAMKETEEYKLDCSPVVLDRQGWLVEWGAVHGMPVGLGRSAEPVLMRALSEGDLPAKLAAIHTLAHAGGPEATEALCEQLSSPEPAVRSAAYRALQAISTRTGTRITRG